MNKSLVTYEGKQFNTTVNKFLVRMDKIQKVSKGGIIIPDTAKLKTDFTGTVVAVSRGMENDKTISVGDKVATMKNIKRVVPTDDRHNEYRLYNKNELFLCTSQSKN